MMNLLVLGFMLTQVDQSDIALTQAEILVLDQLRRLVRGLLGNPQVKQSRPESIVLGFLAQFRLQKIFEYQLGRGPTQHGVLQ
jgi:hypothetical protein